MADGENMQDTRVACAGKSKNMGEKRAALNWYEGPVQLRNRLSSMDASVYSTN